MDDNIVEQFHGVYLLYCLNPKYKGRTYIGYTTDPNRRIKQHNLGKRAGGASRTNNRGPWEMVLIVYGFPNDISALRFEWAWTYPQKSRRLKDAPKKKAKESRFEFCLRILGIMLQTKPWVRLPLTVRWLKQEFQRDFLPGLEPPVHMPIAYGPVKSVKAKPILENKSEERASKICYLCAEETPKATLMRCLSSSCPLHAHVTCFATHFLKDNPDLQLIPVEGECPNCNISLLWGDLVRQYKGCYQKEQSNDLEPHWADALSQVK